jgi:signal peptidase I
VVGKVRVVVLPPSRWQGVGDHDPQVVSMGAPGWQSGIPAGAGFAAAFPVVLLGKRVRSRFRRRRLG